MSFWDLIAKVSTGELGVKYNTPSKLLIRYVDPENGRTFVTQNMRKPSRNTKHVREMRDSGDRHFDLIWSAPKGQNRFDKLIEISRNEKGEVTHGVFKDLHDGNEIHWPDEPTG